ncbi:pyridoxal phosphate-dependent transferase [Gymnopilus junonius]|uniref:Pyridoxal phosphate-dependent transferase n=1 Tax=Gymnopilus junonius TaxID=109634 RepID=A0A9P5TNZ1_GYMJU|nr:pyridoxal phosphate-dependent transferase [Gymnopilus junonius]
MSLADAGDEVILPIPWYFNHQMTLNLLGVKTVALQTIAQDGFLPSVERCRDLITSKTKAIVLVTPNNPTGAIYTPDLISSFASLAREKGVALVIDETYRDFIVSGPAPHTLFSNPSWRDTFIHLFSFSKAYCLPGHRLGAIVASPHLLSSTKKILDTVQICAPRPVQLALAPLLPSLRTFVDHTAGNVHARHILFKDVIPKRWKIGSQGGYYAFVKHPFARVGAADVSRRLAEEMGVVSLPSAFSLGDGSAD